MKILVIGSSGMLGHRLMIDLNQLSNFDVVGVSRKNLNFLDFENITVSELNINTIKSILNDIKPDILINCVGVIKQSHAMQDIKNVIQVNTLLPHLLSRLADDNGCRLIHFSTDCVFSGNTVEPYKNDAYHDALDLYGVSKSLGEVSNFKNTLTIRTSIIGRELYNNTSLLEWFLQQKGKSIRGFKKAYFSGFPTAEISYILANFILPKTDIFGSFNLSAPKISKYDLLMMINDYYDLKVEITPDSDFKIDRSLDSSPLRDMIGYKQTDWSDLIKKLHINDNLYKGVHPCL